MNSCKLLALTALQSGGFCVARSSEVCVIVSAEHWQLLHFMHLRTSLTPGCHFVDELLNILFWRKYVRSRTQILNFVPAVIYKLLGSHNFASLCVGAGLSQMKCICVIKDVLALK